MSVSSDAHKIRNASNTSMVSCNTRTWHEASRHVYISGITSPTVRDQFTRAFPVSPSINTITLLSYYIFQIYGLAQRGLTFLSTIDNTMQEQATDRYLPTLQELNDDGADEPAAGPSDLSAVDGQVENDGPNVGVVQIEEASGHAVQEGKKRKGENGADGNVKKTRQSREFHARKQALSITDLPVRILRW